MFEGAGHHVSSWDSLSPRLDRADCVVWFPDDFQPPGPGAVAWFERWLRARPGRTLIYVGRDFDAVSWYWRKILPSTPAGRQQAVEDLQAAAEGDFQKSRQSNQPNARCRWFSVRYDTPAVRANNISGDLEWLQNLEPAQLEIELNGRIVPSQDMDPLLEADEGLVLGRLEVGRGQIFVAANGSFLLNATLVNREHRKLAGKLVDAIGPAGRDVVFLESRRLGVDQSAGPGGGLPFNPFDMQSDSGSSAPRQQASDDESLVRHDDPPPAVVPNGLELLLIWPTNWILLHFALVGILYCLWKLPIFGLPRPEEPSASADFGRHVDAVAALLQRTADRRYAQSRAKHYQQIVKKID